jgi:hypothetical protein
MVGPFARYRKVSHSGLVISHFPMLPPLVVCRQLGKTSMGKMKCFRARPLRPGPARLRRVGRSRGQGTRRAQCRAVGWPARKEQAGGRGESWETVCRPRALRYRPEQWQAERSNADFHGPPFVTERPGGATHFSPAPGRVRSTANACGRAAWAPPHSSTLYTRPPDFLACAPDALRHSPDLQ